MALFGGKSLVDAVDDIIALVNNWNVMHCDSAKTKSHCKKRAHPSSMLDNMITTPAKRSKLNTSCFNVARNCLVDLEDEARKKLCQLAVEAIKEVYGVEFDEQQQHEFLYAQLTRPKHGRGDIDLPCFKLSKTLKSKPAQIAQDIVANISAAIAQNRGVLFLSNPFKTVTADNGHINAYLTAAYLGQIINLILDEHDSYLCGLPSLGERVMVEYSQPNTHKAFHVGHMRNVALGDCLVRLFDHCGYETVAANYFGDEGAHVAKCLWLIQKEMNAGQLSLDEVERDTRTNLGEWLGVKYADATNKLTLASYTKYPYQGVVVAKVLSIAKHPESENVAQKIPASWHVVRVEYGASGEQATVICGGTDYNVGNLVAYVPVGQRYKDKLAEAKDMKGVTSHGVIMGALELGIKLPPKPTPKPAAEQVSAVVEEDEKKDDKKTKKKKNKKNKNASNAGNNIAKDNRIFLVDQFHSNAKVGDALTELGKYNTKLDDVVKIWKTYVAEQQEVLKKLEAGDAQLLALWQRTRKWSLDEFKRIYAWLDARFDHDFFESECSEDSRQLVDEYYKRGVFVESEGAIGCDLTNVSKQLGFCMLLKSNGCGLYATKDLSLARQKFDQFAIDRSIYVVDAAQSHHFEQVFATLRKMGYAQADKCYHLSYQFVRLSEGKMGSRLGNVILFSELVNLLATEINQLFLDELRKKNAELQSEEEKWSEQELSEAQRAISVGAIRYGMLNHDNNKEIIFDLKKWSMSSGNTGPYLMYQCARINSIGKMVEFPTGVKADEVDFSVLESDEIAKQIIFELAQFQKRVKQICEDTAPSQLCDYLFAICQLFSKWYSVKDNNIKNTKDNELKAARLRFCQSVAETIKVGLKLLGISPLDRM